MKHFFLSVLAGMTAMISGVALGEIADDVIKFFDEYDDKTNDEASDKNSGDTDAAGTAAQNDILYHLATHFYGLLVLATVSLGGYIFMMTHTNFNDEFDCDFDNQLN